MDFFKKDHQAGDGIGKLSEDMANLNFDMK